MQGGREAGKDRILLCDEEPEFLETVGHVLRLEGFEVETLARLAEVPDRLERGGADLLIVGRWGAADDGLRLCGWLRRHADPKVRALPILLTASGRLPAEDHAALKRLNVSVMPKYQRPEQWNHQIQILLHAFAG